MRFSAGSVATAVGGTLVPADAADRAVVGASIDSRSISADCLFVPIMAERDGHEFVSAALAAGAGAYLTSSGSHGEAPRIEVSDTTAALQALGAAARRRLAGSVVGVTGSVGKTSAKDLILAACRATRRTHANVASFNNELGLPLTLVNATDDTEVTIVEMGSRGRGHIADLCAIAQPTVGVVTRVAAAHTELFGSLDGVAEAKGELVEALPSTGTAILNADDARVLAMATRTSADVVSFGMSDSADVAVRNLSLDAHLRAHFEIVTPAGERPVALSIAGEHMALNAAAAIAVALAVGVDLDAAVAGVAEATLSDHRMAVTTAPTGATIINDAYNANPTSMRAALRALTALPVTRRIAVVGVMAELGEEGAASHLAIAEEALAAGIDVVAVDAPAYGGEAGVHHVQTIDQAVEAVAALGPVDDDLGVLVKGSRVAALERVAAQLVAS